LYGAEEVFASHIIYKVPHNYQVILKLELDASVKEAYHKARSDHPNQDIVYVLDPSDVSQIASAQFIVGNLIVRDESGNSKTILSGVRLENSQFSILFFNELPLILGTEPKPPHHAN
jgi:hypothetical protein